ncbi:ATP-dependent nuclease [Undibacterium sp. Di27W]|uniref:ATP-dependent nuclease n=1 Tax=Undibacterium sp. Di27W TaxID=3413036 RepID=UPI003BF0D5E0
MRVTQIQIKNFRLLRNFSLDLENNLSVVIGKNNCGKTSLVAALDKFINSSEVNKINYDDFNIQFKNELVAFLDKKKKIQEQSKYKAIGLELRIYIEYEDKDDLSSVNQLIMNLDPDDNHIVLGFDYKISHARLTDMVEEFQSTKTKYGSDPNTFLRENHSDFFNSIEKTSISFKDPEKTLDLKKEKIRLADVISFKYISAKRSVTNKDNDKTLSTQTSTIYKKRSESQEQESAIEEFKNKLRSTDKDLSSIYETMFSELIQKVSIFGGIKKGDTSIQIASTLQHREILSDNTTVLYTQNDHALPEHYNGLGYMNLISMIFEIDMLMSSFRKSVKEKPTPINLLFLEEPEAHTHPQMQYVFIKNIKSLIKKNLEREDKLSVNLQTIISTHSSHIVSECEFDDIKYLIKSANENSVVAKNLKQLEREYSSEDEKENNDLKQSFKFLKQYLTLNRAELFFADKAILVEGDTERILLPAIMKKLDQENPDDNFSPIISQNISIVEVGAYSQIFEKFIHFLEIKCLIITDIDSGLTQTCFETDGTTPIKNKDGDIKTETKKCVPNDPAADHTSNSALVFFHAKTTKDLSYFLSLPLQKKTLLKKDGKWNANENGQLLLIYQIEEENYHARSFEDAFFHINKNLLKNNPDNFPSLTKKWLTQYLDGNCDAFDFSEKAVGSKPSLAIEILLNSIPHKNSDFSNWKIPKYIYEGLEWLRQQ